MATDIDSGRNDHLLRLKKTATELAAVIISATSLFVTIIAVLFSAFAMFKSDMAMQQMVSLDKEVRLYELYVNNLKAEIKEGKECQATTTQ